MALVLHEYVAVNTRLGSGAASLQVAKQVLQSNAAVRQATAKEPLKGEEQLNTLARLWCTHDGVSINEGARLFAKEVAPQDISDGLVQLWEYAVQNLAPERAKTVEGVILYF